LKDYPNSRSRAILVHFSPTGSSLNEYEFQEGKMGYLDVLSIPEELRVVEAIHRELSSLFSPARGFAEIVKINYTDGLRIYFANRNVVHIRPSGNADELRIYALSDAQAHADQLIEEVVKRDGVLYAIEKVIIA